MGKKKYTPVDVTFKMQPKHDWSSYQKKIFKEISDLKNDLVIAAYAGTAKTTSLVEAVKYVPSTKKVLIVAFNKSIQEDLSKKIHRFNVETKTLHATGARAISQSIGKTLLDHQKSEKIIEELYGKRDYDLISNVAQAVSFCKASLNDTPSHIKYLIDTFGIDLCGIQDKEFISLVIRTIAKSKDMKNIINYDDMCWFPHVHNLSVGQYDIVAVDEFQDLNFSQIMMAKKALKPDGKLIFAGDFYQCVDRDTKVISEFGEINVSDVVVGSKVLSYENGKNTFCTVLNKVKSKWEKGIKITTESGHSLTMSPNHRIWAEQGEIKNKYIVYLMYRKDLGFRVGKTNKWKSKENPFGNRARREVADKLWVLDLVNDNETAIFLEEFYSLKYGIPTMIFEAEERGLNQARADKIFSIFGQNGFQCLKEKNYHFDYPHWIGGCRSTSKLQRLVVRISSHSKIGKTSVNFEVSDCVIIKLLQDNLITGKMYRRRQKDKLHFSVRKRFAKYTDAVIFANKLVELTGAFLTENLSFGKEDDLRLITASALFIGMKVFINKNGILEKDSIVSIDEVPGEFYDLEISNSANFWGNNILSHNCMYSWRLADTTFVKNLLKKPETKLLSLPISYRCPKAVIELAQQMVPHIMCPSTAIEGEILEISQNELFNKIKPGHVLLSRYNAPLIKLAMKFLRNGIRCNIIGRDIGDGLLYLIKKSGKDNLPDLMKWLDKWLKDKLEDLKSKNINPENTIDKVECLNNLIEEASDIDELKKSISELFDDTDKTNIILLSSVHRFKGKECDTVFVLKYTLQYWPNPDLDEVDLESEERNITYVAVTRTKNKLYLVNK